MESERAHIIDIPTARDFRGNLSVLENSQLPFEIARTYWIYDLPSDTMRDGHAFFTQHEIIVPISGSFEITTEDALGRQTFRLSRPNKGLYIPPLTWRFIDSFSTISTMLVISSQLFDENDYIREYDNFQRTIATII